MQYSGRDFDTTLVEGNKTEDAIKNIFISHGYEVIDRANDLEFQKKDIDFQVYSKVTQSYRSYEVKSDNRIAETGNLAIEVFMLRNSGLKKGWLFYCAADYLVYCDAVNHIAYFIDWARLKEGMSDPKYDFRWPIRQFKNTIDNCIGTVRLVKLEDLIKHGYIVWSSSY